MRGDPFDAYEFACREKHEIQPAGLAPAVDVHPVIRLLFPDVLCGLVFAGGHLDGPCGDSIYAFSGRGDRRDLS